ncbi:NAD-dependent epimerase/dehydratase family protein [Nonomuraea dietziae]|uniref:Nucleoside-diphosphate-sugar epimerase n=1 Tax=Nonomuraea dietziae TaxID=65515 RepID=A0A7W5YQU6_9ACTN|nr:NAD-dependent epimerase/dehydratase family protein [Nonomuraea dietziae]MBB3730012.1 nucleoside-diphosphate-sugar epimerase [Nonomuraea dietziae]
MRVLVTGASGTIGGAAARALLRRGHQVVGVVRAVGQAVPEGVEPLVADLFEAGAAAAAAEGVDGAVHAASTNDERAGEFDRVVVRALLDRFAGTGRPLVYTSGLWLHGDTGGVPAAEDAPFDPPSVVAWRPELERMVAEAADGVRTVRIRPGLVYGHGRGYVPAVLAPQEAPGGGLVVRHFGAGDNRWAVVHADDLGELYALALEAAPAGSVYLGVTEDPVRVADAAQVVADRHGARVEAWDPEDAERYWGVMVQPFLLDQVATAARARSELGWRPHHPSLLEELKQGG